MIDERWRKIERAVYESLKQFYMVILMADLPASNGHGPRAEGNGTGFTLPDIQALRWGWIEIKYKKAPWLYELWNELMHGIGAPKWMHYQHVRDESRMPLYLMVMEESTGFIWMQSLDVLRGIPEFGPFAGMCRGRFPDGEPSINWKRSAFVHVGQFFLDGDEPIITWYRPPLDGLLGQLSLELEVV